MKEIKDVSIFLLENEISVGQHIHGTIIISYSGRFDSIVINSQIENSGDGFTFISLNEKRIDYPYGRLSVLKDDIGTTRTLKFIAATTHIPTQSYSNVKFRVSIIQEHKEISHDVSYIKLFK